jgi:hypothetical protein
MVTGNKIYFTSDGSTFGPYKSERAARMAAKKIAVERGLVGETFRYQVSGAGQRMRPLIQAEGMKSFYSGASRGEQGLATKGALDMLRRNQLHNQAMMTIDGAFKCECCGDLITHLYDYGDDCIGCPECGAEPSERDLLISREYRMEIIEN